MKKYSQLLIDEAVQCYRTMKLRDVVKLTGVGPLAIKEAWSKYRKKHGIPPIRESQTTKYTPEQKAACIRLAIRYMDTGHIKSARDAFSSAGKILKINGLTVHRQWIAGDVRGIGELPVQVFQQPGTGIPSPMLSGASTQVASPQSQRCAEQLLEAAFMRPAPSMIKRRKFTSDSLPASKRKAH